MLKTCSKCKSNQISDKTADFYFLISIVLAVIGTILLFFAWEWAFLVITAMLTSVVLAVELPKRKYKCKNCGNEWEEGYAPAGEAHTT